MTTESLLGAGTEPTVAAPATTVTETTTPVVAPVANQQPGTEQSDAPVLDAEGKPVVPPKADEGAPEKYTDFTPPKGVIAPAGELMTEFSALAKELGMSQAKAQDAFALVAKLAEKGQAGKAALEATRAETARTETLASYETATKADPQVGGDKLAENLAIAKAAMHATTTPALRELLEKTGLGSNVEVIRHFLQVAPAFAQDRHVQGGKAPAGVKDAAKVLYPTAA
jgi:hypothetical protein